MMRKLKLIIIISLLNNDEDDDDDDGRSCKSKLCNMTLSLNLKKRVCC